MVSPDEQNNYFSTCLNSFPDSVHISTLWTDSLYLLWFCIMAELADSSLSESQIAIPWLNSFFQLVILLFAGLESNQVCLLSLSQAAFESFMPICARDPGLGPSAALSIWALNLTWGKKWIIHCVYLGSISTKDIWESLNITKPMDCLEPYSASTFSSL